MVFEQIVMRVHFVVSITYLHIIRVARRSTYYTTGGLWCNECNWAIINSVAITSYQTS